MPTPARKPHKADHTAMSDSEKLAHEAAEEHEVVAAPGPEETGPDAEAAVDRYRAGAPTGGGTPDTAKEE